MKQLILAFLLACCAQLSANAQNSPEIKGFKTSVESQDFTINDLYTSEQQLRLQSEAPEKIVEIKNFFQTWNGLSQSVKDQLNKRTMYRLYVRDREKFDAKLIQLAD
jgi:hypothetical protein